MSDHHANLRRLLLVNPDDGSAARGPLGERAHVESLLKELLPRLTFDPSGAGTFTRNGKQLRLQVAGDPVIAIELELAADSDVLMPPLERVVAKTGWKLIDPDRPDLVIINTEVTNTTETSSEKRRWRVVALVAAVPVVAGCVWWATVGSRGYVITGDRDAGRRMLQTPDPNNPTAAPEVVERFFEQARVASAIMARERSLDPQFKGLPVVHELMIADEAETQYHVSTGAYADPAVLAESPSRPAFPGLPVLPPRYASPSRGGYRFEFIGKGEKQGFHEEDYESFVYVASPESDAVGVYTFALISETGRIHFRTDGRVPDAFDPSVTDRVAEEAPARVALPGRANERPNEPRQESWLRRLITRVFGSVGLRDPELSYQEDRAIKDLRVLQSAEQVFISMIGGQGYAPPEVLSDPSILGLRFREWPPLVDGYFAQETREGYRFTFEGSSPVQVDTVTVYGEFTYVAIPVGDGPANRRSYSITPDGLIRFRTDGAAPGNGDTILGTEK